KSKINPALSSQSYFPVERSIHNGNKIETVNDISNTTDDRVIQKVGNEKTTPARRQPNNLTDKKWLHVDGVGAMGGTVKIDETHDIQSEHDKDQIPVDAFQNCFVAHLHGKIHYSPSVKIGFSIFIAGRL